MQGRSELRRLDVIGINKEKGKRTVRFPLFITIGLKLT